MTKTLIRTTATLWAAILCTTLLVEASASQHRGIVATELAAR